MDIYILSPSGVIRDKASLHRALVYLEGRGYTVMLDPQVLDQSQRFAGSDQSRLNAITRATESNAKVILISRGGYGLTRLLPKIPYQKIADSVARKTIWLGFSDFTALQLACLAQQQAILTWAGPMAVTDFGSTTAPDKTLQMYFDRLICGQLHEVSWRLEKSVDNLGNENQPLFIENAMLWGGNLCVLTSLLGTPWFPHIENGILFLEDIAEEPYRIERMLMQLYLAGVLNRQRAILLGSFTHAKTSLTDSDYDIYAVVRHICQCCGIPILMGLPFGHIRQKLCLPVGKKVNLYRDGNLIQLSWEGIF
jgi:muramoyltetrapeptide carboxypeptidase